MNAEWWEAKPKYRHLNYATILELDLLGKTQGKCYDMLYVQVLVVLYQVIGLWKVRTNRDIPDTLDDPICVQILLFFQMINNRQ